MSQTFTPEQIAALKNDAAQAAAAAKAAEPSFWDRRGPQIKEAAYATVVGAAATASGIMGARALTAIIDKSKEKAEKKVTERTTETVNNLLGGLIAAGLAPK